MDGNKTSSNYKELFGLTRNRSAGSNKTRHGTSLSLSLSLSFSLFLSLPLSSFNSTRSSVQQFRGLASIWLVEALSTSSRDGHEGLDNRKDAGLIISGTKNPRQERVDPLEYFSENFSALAVNREEEGEGRKKRPRDEASRVWIGIALETDSSRILEEKVYLDGSWRKLVFTYKGERDRSDIFWIKHSCLPRSGF